MADLTIQQKKFADKYIETGNGAESYKFAYPTCKKDETARTNASRLLTKANVNSYITKVQAELQKGQKVTLERIIHKLAEEAFGPGINDVVEIDQGYLKFKDKADLSGIDSISHTTGKVDSISVKRKDQLKALDMLMKTLGIGAYGKDGSEDPGRVFESNAGRVLDALKGLRGKKGS